MRTMPSFTPEQTVIPKTEIDMKETLLRKLLNRQISDIAFNNAMKLMEVEKTPHLDNTGYLY